MTKVKEKLYEHRYGLLFFAALMVYSIVISNKLEPWQVSNFSFSFYVVDFSLGFCSKLLPGAAFNLFFDNLTKEKVSMILSILVTICFFIFSMLLGEAYRKTVEKNKKTFLIIIAFFLTGPVTFSKYFDLFCWLDFFWLFSAVISILCLSRKTLYIFVIPLMWIAIMSHYGAILCYVPFIAIFMLYMLSEEENKRIKRYLTVVWVILVVTSLALAGYLIAFETKNINLTFDELKKFFADRGVENGDYFYYAFFRTSDTTGQEEYFAEKFGDMISVAGIQNPVLIFLTTIIQQIQVTLKLFAFEEAREIVMSMPVIAFIYRIYIEQFRTEKNNKLRKFVLFCMPCLMAGTSVFGILLSTDTTRWISHGIMPAFIMMFYMMQREKAFALKVTEAVDRIPPEILTVYFLMYAST